MQSKKSQDMINQAQKFDKYYKRKDKRETSRNVNLLTEESDFLEIDLS